MLLTPNKSIVSYTSDIPPHDIGNEFGKYLVEVNIQEVRLKEVARMQHAEDEAHLHRLPPEESADGGLEPVEEWTTLVPDSLPQCLLGQAWGDEYVSSVFHWASTLRWPPRPVVQDEDSAVTFLELFAHFAAWSKLLPRRIYPLPAVALLSPLDLMQGVYSLGPWNMRWEFS